MLSSLYLNAAVAISPQRTFGSHEWQKEISIATHNQLYVQDAPYHEYINPVAIRRMGRIIKMGITAGMKALEEAKVAMPDAIITGTGRGSMTNNQSFLMDIITYKEEALNPTNFIQSTYNNINGWLALQSNSNTYNQTFVHRGCSFEWALLDAAMLAKEPDREEDHFLVGCFDELTHEFYTIYSHKNFWKKDHVPNDKLWQHSHTAGTIAGEGVNFFCLSNKRSDKATRLCWIDFCYDASAAGWQLLLQKMKQEIPHLLACINVVLYGANGDVAFQPLYKEVLSQFPDAVASGFKHLCGEYDTATGFALFVAHEICQAEAWPEVLVASGNVAAFTQPKYVLIVNHYTTDHLSVVLLANE